MPTTFNYYETKLDIVTARRAQILGLTPTRHYGYYVIITPKPPSNGHYQGERDDLALYSWCRTKRVAIAKVEDDNHSKLKGYHGCPCGNQRQARACCGIPIYKPSPINA
jgi:hypothetical protein